jgi:hypothetical protein
MKTTIEYLLLLAFKALLFPVSVICFPLAYPFRKKAYAYTSEHGNTGWHPIVWANWFFTKDGRRGDWYTGPLWYMQELKEKTFHYWTTDCKEDPIPISPWQHIIYFIIAYRWGALRNFMWNLRRIVLEEGGTWQDLKPSEIDIISDTTGHAHPFMLPQLKYTDRHCNYRDNKGPLLLFFGMCGFPESQCTILGKKRIEFPTKKKGKRRFLYRKATARPVFNKYIIAHEFYWGWHTGSGTPTLYLKFKII